MNSLRCRLHHKINKLKQTQHPNKEKDDILKIVKLDKFDHSIDPQIWIDKLYLFRMSDEEIECTKSLIVSLSAIESNTTCDIKELKYVWLNEAE